MSPRGSITGWLVSFLFLCAIALPGLGTVWQRHTPLLASERRTAAPMPKFPAHVRDLPKYLASWSEFFADAFAFRDALVRLHNLILAEVFEVSPIRQVAIGRNGWFYYIGDDGRDLERAIRANPPFPEVDLYRLQAELDRRSRWLGQRGIAFLFVVAPDKASIYPEFLPASISRHAQTPTRLDQFMAHMRRHSTTAVLDLRSAILQAKATRRTFYRRDSHWNPWGYYAGYVAVISRLAELLPALSLQPRDYKPREPREDMAPADLADMMDLSRWLVDRVVPRHGILPAPDCTQSVTTPPTEAVWLTVPVPVITECASAQATAIVLHDSFIAGAEPFYSQHFRKVFYDWTPRMYLQFVEQVQPDVVITEITERNLAVLLEYSSWPEEAEVAQR
jgi:alginate O-acetyltransferase complex protein AlgJ